jgi:drug/metabolite transporter (DMT)-like permease
MDKGSIYMLVSALSFALSTVFAKYAYLSEALAPAEAAFFRFLVGFILAALYTAATRPNLVPKKPVPVALRAIANAAAVLLFFAGIEGTTVSKANMLNLTYPVYVALFAPLINRERIGGAHIPKIILAAVGMYLVISPDFGTISMGDIYSLASGVMAGLSIAFVREAGKNDSKTIILFYLMAAGLILTAALVFPDFRIPGRKTLIFLVLSGFAGYIGQVTSTAGYGLIEAAKGSLLSVSRIIYSVILGIILFGDPLTLKIVLGGVLILSSLIGIRGAAMLFSFMRPARR